MGTKLCLTVLIICISLGTNDSVFSRACLPSIDLSVWSELQLLFPCFTFGLFYFCYWFMSPLYFGYESFVYYVFSLSLWFVFLFPLWGAKFKNVYNKFIYFIKVDTYLLFKFFLVYNKYNRNSLPCFGLCPKPTANIILNGKIWKKISLR